MIDSAARALHGVGPLRGTIEMPPDKSIAQRAALFAPLSQTTCVLENYPRAADPQSALSVMEQLGVRIERSGTTVTIVGVGKDGLRKASGPIDCGNSGTTMRLLSGILAGQSFESTLIGDASLSRRPMRRVAHPLSEMGAQISLTNGCAPMTLHGGTTSGIHFALPVPSAQVKSCMLLAGLFASGVQTVEEFIPSRDHTERMLGLSPKRSSQGSVYWEISRDHDVPDQSRCIPGDFSSAAFFLVAGTIVTGSDLVLRDTGLNPTRTASLAVLKRMGAQIEIVDERIEQGEPVGTIRVTAAPMQATVVEGEEVPNLIDEIPILALAATQATGVTTFRDAAELRVKETDRIEAVADTLRRLGARVETFADGLAIEGPTALRGNVVDSGGDHRIAMMAGVAAQVASGTTTILNAEAASVSYPDFWEHLEGLSAS